MTVYSDKYPVLNQVKHLIRQNAFLECQTLSTAVESQASQNEFEILKRYGQNIAHLEELGDDANRNLPVLNSYDRYGHRVDRVDYKPSYHALMDYGCQAGLHALPWSSKGSHLTRMGLMFIQGQADAGTCCPLSMTFAGYPLLEQNDYLKKEWQPKVLNFAYDKTHNPSQKKHALTLGMSMTEKQGGSDVRANICKASHLEKDLFALDGHKWFCSAPMSDGFFVTAKIDDKISCFLVPRFKRDGNKNSLHIMRLKDKLGNRSNASTEIELAKAEGWLVGEQGAGIQTIIQMVALTRFDCVVGSTALTYQALVQAIHHCQHRQAFDKLLIEQPLMQVVLGHCAFETECFLQLSIHLAHLLDQNSEQSKQQLRLLTAMAKYWVCKRSVQVVAELIECLGGAGFIEDFMLARLYREAPLNSIWEGCGNIQCLDVLRTIQKQPHILQAFWQITEHLNVTEVYLDNERSQLQSQLEQVSEHTARLFVERCMRWFSAVLVAKHSQPVFKDNTQLWLQGANTSLLGGLDLQQCQHMITALWSTT